MTSKAQLKANYKYKNNHKQQQRYYVYHSTANHFIKIAKLSDVKDLMIQCKNRLRKGDNKNE